MYALRCSALIFALPFAAVSTNAHNSAQARIAKLKALGMGARGARVHARACARVSDGGASGFASVSQAAPTRATAHARMHAHCWMPSRSRAPARPAAYAAAHSQSTAWHAAEQSDAHGSGRAQGAAEGALRLQRCRRALLPSPEAITKRDRAWPAACSAARAVQCSAACSTCDRRSFGATDRVQRPSPIGALTTRSPAGGKARRRCAGAHDATAASIPRGYVSTRGGTSPPITVWSVRSTTATHVHLQCSVWHRTPCAACRVRCTPAVRCTPGVRCTTAVRCTIERRRGTHADELGGAARRVGARSNGPMVCHGSAACGQCRTARAAVCVVPPTA